jgi:nitroreductase
MDVFEAVDSRISCRWFLDRPVAPELVRKLIIEATRAASGGNLQPWQAPFVNMPKEQMLFCAVSIGYGDRNHPANSFRSPRAVPEEFCRFFGFE